MRSSSLHVVVLLVASCTGDDDAALDDGGVPQPDARVIVEAGMDGASEVPDATPGAPLDAGGDASVDPNPDAALRCTDDVFPTWLGGGWSGVPATRIAFSPLCRNSGCVDLASFEADLTCTESEDGGIVYLLGDLDAGLGFPSFGTYVRIAGCGYVQFGNLRPNWPRYYNFEADSGELVGRAQADDVTSPPCDDAAYVSGVVEPECTDVTISLCEPVN